MLSNTTAVPLKNLFDFLVKCENDAPTLEQIEKIVAAYLPDKLNHLVVLLNECLTHYYEETFAGYGTLTLSQTQDWNVIPYAISREIKSIIAAPAS